MKDVIYMNLSKSRYTKGVTCEKYLWLSCYKPELAEDMGNQTVFENGNKVGDLARSLFGDYKLVEYTTDYKKMIDDTKKYIDNKEKAICEASFSYDGNFISVDVLKVLDNGLEIYEVKSSTEVKNIYIDDISYQTWVLKKLGYNVLKSSIVYVNNQYIKNGDLNIKDYFVVRDVTELIDLDKVEDNVKELKKVLDSNLEPNIDLSINCFDPYNCPYFKYCTKKLKSPNVFDLGWGFTTKKKLDLYYKNIIEYEDLLKSGLLNEKTTNQVQVNLGKKKEIIDKDYIKNVLDTLKFPLYFLDFESYQDAIPVYDGTKPYQQLCFQYSLHIIDKDGTITHKEYLHDKYDTNPIYGLCESLCNDIPKDVCVVVYNDGFEKSRLREMAYLIPELSEHLLNIRENIVDLLPIFKNQKFYTKDMKGSASIKYVLPALYPNDESLNYHNLDQVHKGDEASAAYLSLKDLPEEDRDTLRKNMLKYCELDTYAMVKIYEKLRDVVD